MDTDHQDALLTLLGLDPLEDTVYRLLVGRPDATADGLADSSIDAATLEATLGSLVEHGLASAETADGTTRYRAASPALALGPLVDARRTALRDVESLVGDLTDRHRSARAVTPVEVLTGASAIRRRLIAIQAEARHEVCSLVPAMTQPKVITFEDNMDEAERDSAARGVTMRAVIERDLLEQPGAGAGLAGALSVGQQIAVVEALPIKLVLVDRRVALLPLDPEREDVEPVALFVHRSGLVTALQSLFEQYFRAGRPLQVPGEEGLEAGHVGSPIELLDQRIISLMRVGLTDAAIARQLGIGHRTVQRRLHDLMQTIGAATRFQLGWHASSEGWLGAHAESASEDV